jgi:hypothetical protein
MSFLRSFVEELEHHRDVCALDLLVRDRIIAEKHRELEKHKRDRINTKTLVTDLDVAIKNVKSQIADNLLEEIGECVRSYGSTKNIGALVEEYKSIRYGSRPMTR